MRDHGTVQRPEAGPGAYAILARRTLTVVTATLALAAGVLALTRLYPIVLLVFACVLMALLLHSLSCFIGRHSGVRHGTALILSALLALAGVVALGLLIGKPLVREAGQLRHRLPQSLEQLRSRMSELEWGRAVAAEVPVSRHEAARKIDHNVDVRELFFDLLEALAFFLVFLLTSFHLAREPALYLRGALHLVPRRARKQTLRVLDALGHTLLRWAMGTLVTMTAVGMLTGLGLWLIGVPMALAVGVLAGLLQFVPFLGPPLAILPAVLLALAESPSLVFWVLLLFGGVQMIESNLLVPLVQQKAVRLPPPLTIGAQVTMGMLFGPMGVLLATPMMASLVLLVRLLYFEDAPGDGMQPPALAGEATCLAAAPGP
jgi:predicted PurR-regulated permease PerM